MKCYSAIKRNAVLIHTVYLKKSVQLRVVRLCFIQGLTEDYSLDDSLSVALRGLSEEAEEKPVCGFWLGST